jgi:hypothetical protein
MDNTNNANINDAAHESNRTHPCTVNGMSNKNAQMVYAVDLRSDDWTLQQHLVELPEWTQLHQTLKRLAFDHSFAFVLMLPGLGPRVLTSQTPCTNNVEFAMTMLDRMSTLSSSTACAAWQLLNNSIDDICNIDDIFCNIDNVDDMCNISNICKLDSTATASTSAHRDSLEHLEEAIFRFAHVWSDYIPTKLINGVNVVYRFTIPALGCGVRAGQPVFWRGVAALAYYRQCGVHKAKQSLDQELPPPTTTDADQEQQSKCLPDDLACRSPPLEESGEEEGPSTPPKAHHHQITTGGPVLKGTSPASSSSAYPPHCPALCPPALCPPAPCSALSTPRRLHTKKGFAYRKKGEPLVKKTKKGIRRRFSSKPTRKINCRTCTLAH